MRDDYSVAAISSQELDALDREYTTFSKNAHTDVTYESDYQAAFRVPAAFLKKPSNFELAFDRILFHLDAAYRKSNDLNTRSMVSRASDDLFHGIISIIQFRIDSIEKENAKGLFQKISESINNFIDSLKNELFALNDPRIAVAKSLAPEVLNLSRAFFEFMLIKWELKKEVTFFYNQLANVYQKILNSKSFSHEHGLIRNTFAANKERVLTYVTAEKGMSAALNLMRFDQSDIERQDSARIITRALIENLKWEKGADFLHEMKLKRVGNYGEIEEDFLKKYKELVDHLKRKKGKDDPQKDILSAYPTPEAIRYRVNGDQPGYDLYLKKYKRTERIHLLCGYIILFVIIGGISVYYSNAKTNYLNSAKKESARIAATINAIDTSVKNQDFHTAVAKLNDDLYWYEKSFFSDDDEKRTKALKREKCQYILNCMLQVQQGRQSQVMDLNNYNYVTNNLLPLYNHVVKYFADEDLQKPYSEKMKSLLKELDRTRDAYLVQLQLEIKSKLEKKEADAAELLKDVYHLSEEKYKADGFIDGLFADSYKVHWQKERDKLLELMNGIHKKA